MAALAGITAFASCSVNDDIQDRASVRFTAGIDAQAIPGVSAGTITLWFIVGGETFTWDAGAVP